MKKDESIPWHDMMAIALGVLQIPPETFWSMTISELEALYKGKKMLFSDSEPPKLRDVIEMMGKFPD